MHLKADIVITNGDKELMIKSLSENKIVLAAVEMGPNVEKSITDKWSNYFQAHVQVKEKTDEGICFCQKPATHLVYFWR